MAHHYNLVAVAENDLNITQAARVLVRTTDAGNKVIDRASQIVRQARSIKALQLHGAGLAARAVCPERAHTERGAHGLEFGRHQEVRP